MIEGKMRYFSVCSGVEAASQAWERLGWEPLAFAEIEPFPCAVLASRYPSVPNLGDMTQIHYNKETKELYNGTTRIVCDGGIDLLVGGTPCQSFSIAGARKGLEGASGLAYHFIRLLHEIQPKWFVWENVPGCLSSVTNGQRDFNFLLRQYAECGYVLEWRVLDTQFVRVESAFPLGIPQRRRRLFVVGHLAADGGSFKPVLLEPESVFGNPAPRRIKGKEVARHLGIGIEGASREVCGIDPYNHTSTGDVSKTLNTAAAQDTDHTGAVAIKTALGVSMDANFGFPCIEECAHTMKQGTCPGHKQAVIQKEAIGIGRDAFNSGKNAQMAMSITEELMPPQTAVGGGGGMREGMTSWQTSNGDDVFPTVDTRLAAGVSGQLEHTGGYVCGRVR